MRILLTNDDGITAPGLRSLYDQLTPHHQVEVVAPHTERSGVGHAITFLTPVICQRVPFADGTAWSVEGMPADCVKLAVTQLLEDPPDVVVSGINAGLNAGINVLYSGTVAAALEGAFRGIPSFAISQEFETQIDFHRAAAWFADRLPQLLPLQVPGGAMNLNIPTAALHEPQLRVVPMGRARYGDEWIRSRDPRGRDYFWGTNDPPPRPEAHETDMSSLAAGYVTLTPLHFDITDTEQLAQLQQKLMP